MPNVVNMKPSQDDADDLLIRIIRWLPDDIHEVTFRPVKEDIRNYLKARKKSVEKKVC